MLRRTTALISQAHSGKFVLHVPPEPCRLDRDKCIGLARDFDVVRYVIRRWKPETDLAQPRAKALCQSTSAVIRKS